MNTSLTSQTPRGLTLLEVLVATAILAIMASAVVPPIAQALSMLREKETSNEVDRADFAAVVGAFLLDPRRFGVDLTNAGLHEIGEQRITWPQDEARYEQYAGRWIDIRTIHGVADSADGADHETEHLWISFTCDQVQLVRWIAIPPKIDLQRQIMP